MWNYDVVANCTGLGARGLLDDNLTHPIRGQVMRVKANWVYEVFSDDSMNGNYIIPKWVRIHGEQVVMTECYYELYITALEALFVVVLIS